MRRYTKTEKAEVQQRLAALISRGQTIYTIMRHQSNSGRTRYFDYFVVQCDQEEPLRQITGELRGLLDLTHGRSVASGVVCYDAYDDSGAGVVYQLSQLIFGETRALSVKRI